MSCRFRANVGLYFVPSLAILHLLYSCAGITLEVSRPLQIHDNSSLSRCLCNDRAADIDAMEGWRHKKTAEAAVELLLEHLSALRCAKRVRRTVKTSSKGRDDRDLDRLLR